jgi:hypothetical protein
MVQSANTGRNGASGRFISGTGAFFSAIDAVAFIIVGKVFS